MIAGDDHTLTLAFKPAAIPSRTRNDLQLLKKAAGENRRLSGYCVGVFFFGKIRLLIFSATVWVALPIKMDTIKMGMVMATKQSQYLSGSRQDRGASE